MKVRSGGAGPQLFGGRLMRTRRTWNLLIQRLSVAYAAPEKLRPCRHCWLGVLFLGKQSPEIRVMPAQLVARAVTMRTNPLPQLLDFRDELFARHTIEILFHDASSKASRQRTTIVRSCILAAWHLAALGRAELRGVSWHRRRGAETPRSATTTSLYEPGPVSRRAGSLGKVRRQLPRRHPR